MASTRPSGRKMRSEQNSAPSLLVSPLPPGKISWFSWPPGLAPPSTGLGCSNSGARPLPRSVSTRLWSLRIPVLPASATIESFTRSVPSSAFQ